MQAISSMYVRDTVLKLQKKEHVSVKHAGLCTEISSLNKVIN